ncbi:MAG: formylglycine-generating enzyme family protein [Microscillaceae bacterium]|nr:formylglycine-generating enzyme family protein [Microscillaceae bacterium]
MNQKIRIIALLILLITLYSGQAQAQCDYTFLLNKAESAYDIKDDDQTLLRFKSTLTSDGPTDAQKQEIQNGIDKEEKAKTHPPSNDPFEGQMVQIRGGTFLMGSPSFEPERESDETQHYVTLRDYKMGKYEVSQAQWQAVMGSNPSYFGGCDHCLVEEVGTNYACDNCPVERVSWNDIQGFLQKLNAMTGKQYRLPTEAEWEYACRAGTSTPFHTGNNLITDQANYDGNYPYDGNPEGQNRQETSLVGSFAPNAWGLYDMHGNVWEWCSDWYGAYALGAQTNPEGATTGSDRVLRGGSWYLFARRCRSAFRYFGTPANRYNSYGFRLASF